MLTLLILIALIILLPIFLYFWCIRRPSDHVWIPSRRNIISRLKRVKAINGFTQQIQEQEDSELFCSICLDVYLPDDYVTMLPCDERHAFHTKCIEAWLDKSNRCPLCKKKVD